MGTAAIKTALADWMKSSGSICGTAKAVPHHKSFAKGKRGLRNPNRTKVGTKAIEKIALKAPHCASLACSELDMKYCSTVCVAGEKFHIRKMKSAG